MKKLFGCFVFAVFVSLALLSLSAPAMAGTGVQELIVANLYTCGNLSISRDKVAYYDYRNGNMDVYMYDLGLKSEVRITTNSFQQVLPDLSGNIIVWKDYRNNIWNNSLAQDIYAYDLTLQSEIRITLNPIDSGMPRISGNKIIWSSLQQPWGQYAGTFVYDLNTQITTRISDYRYYATISGNNIAWVHDWWESTGSISNIFNLEVYNLQTQTVINVPNASTNYPPEIDGSRIVWNDKSNGGTDIYSYDLLTQAKTPISVGAGILRYNPSISGSKVVWMDNRNDELNWDVYMYDLSAQTEMRITAVSGQYGSPRISGNKIVWVNIKNDGRQVTRTDIYMYEIENPNIPPIANPGSSQAVHVGNVVTLDGSSSTDPDGNYPLSYAWTMVSVPQGNSVVINNPTSVNSTFIANASGDYVLSLVVTDSKGMPSQSAEVKISTTNTSPVAHAGQDQLVTTIGTVVALDGSKSFDVDGDPITHQWHVVSKPEGSNAALNDPTAIKPTFIADVHGNYVFSEIVSDGLLTSSPAQVTVGFNNIKPVANAGNNQTVVVGTVVNLNGTQSFDANGDALTYHWNLVTMLLGSQAVLASANTAITSFAPNLAGQYVASLTVNDGFMDSEPSNMSIMVITYQTATTQVLMQTIATINNIPAILFNNPNNKNALTNKINAALGNIDAGNYAIALSQLQNDILGKTNGCATTGAPDKNDWITTESNHPSSVEIQVVCAAQGQVYPLIMQAIGYLNNLH